MKILIDLGNTRLKWAVVRGEQWQPGMALTYAEESLDEGMAKRWRGWSGPSGVWVASVAGREREEALAKLVREQFGLAITFVRSIAYAAGVTNAYAEPERLGVDRFLALVAVHRICTTPLVLVGCGTALTVDVLGVDGQHLGGLISPSPALMQQALFSNTAQLRPGFSNKLVELANNTHDAIYSGTWLAAVALIERQLSLSTQRFGFAPDLFLSGGASQELQKALDGRGHIEPDLVLQGLSIYSNQAPAP